MEPVVSVDWLADHLEDDGLRVHDATIHAARVLGHEEILTAPVGLSVS
ncbi:MAG: hypothetical protein R2720_10025 [Candidatus Nanopelagicales bacterium]